MDRTKLIKAYNKITDRILEITENPKPSYDIDGKSVDWGQYWDSLTKAQKSLREQLDMPNDDPFELAQTMII